MSLIGFCHFAFCILHFALSADSLEIAERAEAARIAMIERVAPAVVCIFDEGERGGGSGVIIDEEGYGLTNFHVVAGMLESRKGLGGLSDGRLYDLQVLGIDPGGDVAMFKLSGRDKFPFVRLADSDRVQVGDIAIAMGNPFMLSEDYTPTVTLGIVSGIHRYQMGEGDTLLYSDCIQVDASINPGNSGGPLFNVDGEIIGINGRISVSMRGRVNVGLGYAITSNQIRSFMPALRAGLLAEHATMQAVARDRPDGCVVFVELLEGGPAWAIGIRPGDALLRFAGRQISSANEYASILGTLPADWPVAVSYQKPNGQVVHRETRTEPIKLKEADAFEPDPTANLIAVERLLARFHTVTGLHNPGISQQVTWGWIETHTPASGSKPQAVYRFEYIGTGPIVWGSQSPDVPSIHVTDEGAVYEQPTGPQPLATDLDLIYRSLFHLHRTLLPATTSGQMAAFRHRGADNLLAIDEAGNVDSTLLECIALPIGRDAKACFEFEVETARLRRIVATDPPTKEEVRITFDTAIPWPATAVIECPSGNFTVTRRDMRTPLPAGDRANNSVPIQDTPAPDRQHRPATRPAIDRLTTRVVKLIGAKVGRSPGYGSGVIVSPDGLMLTVDSALLDAADIRAYLSDGSQCGVESIYSDRRSHLALLRLKPRRGADGVEYELNDTVDGNTSYPYFDLNADVPLTVGQWLFAGGNPFKVAARAERISIARGVYCGTIRLDATRGTQDFPYHGDVLVIDAIAGTPGFPGGALVDAKGRLVGMIGRVVKSRMTHTVLNHAIPVAVLSRFVSVALESGDRHPPPESRPVYHGIKFFELGYQSNPVYVERVRRGSPAARAGVRKDDLVIGANGQPVPKLETIRRIIKECQPGDTLELTLIRKNKVRKVRFKLEELPQ